MRYAIIVLGLLCVLASPRPFSATANDFLETCGLDDAGGHACVNCITGWRDAFYIATYHTFTAVTCQCYG